MKMLKKLFAFVAAFAMLLALPTTVLAEETHTITAPDNGHTYEIYQIFTGDLATDGTLSNVKWGQNGTLKVNEKETAKVGEAVPESVLKSLTDSTLDTDAKKLAQIKNYANLTNPVATIGKISTTEETLTWDGADGYYLIKDKDGTVTGTDSYTLYLVKVAGNVTITPKSDVPTSEKKVIDKNDTDGTETGWQDSADYDIGDTVKFKLTGTVSSKYDDFTVYKFTFHDKESAGLTFAPDSVVVKVDGKQITTGYVVQQNVNHGTTENPNIDTFDVVFDDLKQIKDDDGTALVHAESVITVEYNSTLNTNAVIGSAGNPNVMHLEFSNNPNDAQGGETGTTPDDKVIVFTYKTVINKVAKNSDGELEPLDGAEFTLKKVKVDENGNPTEEVVKTYTYSENDGTTTFTFKGLDDGTYKLEETKTPSGYNTIEPIVFTITAEHDVLEDDPKLTSMSVDRTDVFTVDSDSGKTTPAGSLTADIENKKGTILPSTGGIGTTVFYVTGAILMLGAGVLLVSRKRVSK